MALLHCLAPTFAHLPPAFTKSLTADLCRAARRARGKQGDHTWKGRGQAFARFAQFLWNAGYQIHTVGQIREKHFRARIDDLIARGRAKRTIANNATHIRTALEGIGRRPFADKVSNASLGIAGASRAGTKRPMSPDEFEPYRVAAAATDPGVALVLELELELGLRAQGGGGPWSRSRTGFVRLPIRWAMAM
ncbi:phage integrase N-terminal domain-containing protein [Paraburkholderia sediminicola]|uniref:phage integrase N-terminal domain-containing protein n=1 Tax=Paraburkholderia sediminicola TaxID=458836 RepID=UPI0038B9AEB1